MPVTALGFFVGVASSILAFYIKDIYTQKKHRNTLRTSFIAELEANQIVDAEATQDEPVIPLNPICYDEIYKANASQMGLLSEDEVEALVKYYTIASETEKLRDYTISAGLDPSSPNLDVVESEFQNQLQVISEWKSIAVEELSNRKKSNMLSSFVPSLFR